MLIAGFASMDWNTALKSLAQLAWAAECTDCIKCSEYDTKQCDCEALVMLELWGMQSTPSLSLLPGPLWLGVVAPNRVLPIGWIELNCIIMLNWIVWN